MACANRVKLQVRRDTASNWTGRILCDGEPGFDTTNQQLRIGWNSQPWDSLPILGTGSSSGASVDPLLLKNIGLNAYISSADLLAVWNAANNAMTYTLTFHGNSTYYDVTFSYYTTAGTPVAPGTIAQSAWYYTNTTDNYNNDGAPAGPHPHFTVTPSTTITSQTPGVYIVRAAIDTVNAGGVGTGSSYTASATVTIAATDSMGAPTLAFFSPPSISASTAVIGGNAYYTSGTSIQTAADTVILNNIYNSSNRSLFTCMALSETLLTSHTASLSTGDLDFNASATAPANPLAPYSQYLSTTLGQNLSYYNHPAISFPLNSTSNGGNYVKYQLTNAKSAQSAVSAYFPAAPIAYVGTLPPNESVIPLSSLTNTLVSAQTRMSLATGANVPPAGADITAYLPTSLTRYDLSYNPMNGFVYTTTTGLQAALATYSFPSGHPPSLNDTGGVPSNRYFVVRITTTGPLGAFTVSLGANASCVSNIYVRWGETGGFGGWLDASVIYTARTGCRGATQSGGTSPYFVNWPIRMSAIYGTPTASWTSSDPYIYVIMVCNTSGSGGTISPTGFVVQ